MLKKIVVICMILFICFGFAGCSRKQFTLHVDNIELEHGEMLPDMKQFIGDEADKDKILIDCSGVVLQTKGDKKFPAVGNYEVIYTYGKIEKVLTVNVKNDEKPQFSKVSDEIDIYSNETIKINELFTAKDPQCEITFDESDINYKKSGKYKVCVKVSDFTDDFSTHELIVNVTKTDIKLKKDNYELTVGDTIDLKPTIIGRDNKVTYTCDSSCISVSQNGTVYAKKEGTATIYIESNDIKKECLIKVNAKKEIIKDELKQENVKEDSNSTTNNEIDKEVVELKKYSLNVPYYNQYDAGAPMGCEAASLLQALHYKGYAKEYNLKSFLKVMPYSKNDNPYEGYSGTPYKYLPYPTYQSIFPVPLTNWANQYGTAVNISDKGVKQLQTEIKNGNPVVVYMSYKFAKPQWVKYDWGTGMDNMHVMTLIGYNEKTKEYQVCDPVKGKYWVSKNKFETSFKYLNWAVAVR